MGEVEAALMRRGPRLNALLSVFALAVVAAFVGAGVLGAFTQTPIVIWQGAQLKPCAMDESQAVTMARFNATRTDGCKTWLVMTPPSEGGDYAAETAFYQAHKGSIQGVILDDFQYSGSAGATELSTLVSDHVAVCPVLYPFLAQPSDTRGLPCVIVGVRPGEQVGSDGFSPPGSPVASLSAWTTIMRADMAKFNATHVHLLVYEAPTSFWHLPVPANYTQAAAEISASDGQFLVKFY